ncbi:MAG TPA: CRISPR system precrRNA processing endoribonuclease RAMP protein Cas6 [Firmicutes bacterium]|nr:CRISPR system precrRNA processing endoribonuclease RAMP protein Cas6 [Bacillota bacterium]
MSVVALGDIRIALFEFSFRVQSKVLLPPYKGSALRGAFGTIFRRITCSERGLNDCSPCDLRSACPYGKIFEPGPPNNSTRLRNLENVPRPFVLRPPLDAKLEYAPDDQIVFWVVLAGWAIEYLPYFIVALNELGHDGLGSKQNGKRGKVELERVRMFNPLYPDEFTVFDGKIVYSPNDSLIVTGQQIDEETRLRSWNPLTVEFLTMTRLKYENEFVASPPFHVLLRSLLRRYSTIAYFYHGIEPDLDFAALIKEATGVRTVDSRLRWVDWERYSTRQKASMNMGGIIGTVTYSGDIEPFGSLLMLGELIHVGKGTTFGLGQYRLVNRRGAPDSG